MSQKNNQNAMYGKNTTDEYEERNAKLQLISDEILEARLDKDAHYTRAEAVSYVAKYIYRLYDYYSVYSAQTISGRELEAMLSQISV